jgi:hypothetical protein
MLAKKQALGEKTYEVSLGQSSFDPSNYQQKIRLAPKIFRQPLKN